MEKLFTKIIGTPVYEDGPRPITSVKDLVLDPVNGKVVAFVVSVGGRRVISPMDVIDWHDVVRVNSVDAIVNSDEILRLEEVLKNHNHIFRVRVETDRGKYLGRVYDFSIRTDEMILSKLYVSRGLWGLFRFDGRIIPHRNIVEILPNKIIVKDDAAVVKEEKKKVLFERATS